MIPSLPYPGRVTRLPGNALWHGFADMNAVAGRDFVLSAGDGCYVVDESGKRYLDSTAALWFCNIGHGRRELAEAAAKQMSDLAAYSSFGDFATRAVAHLLIFVVGGAGFTRCGIGEA